MWRKQVGQQAAGHAFTNALTYYDGKLLTGSSGGDAGAPAFVIALDAKTGRTLWKFNVIPQNRSDPGWNTWPAKRAFNGGGAMWNQLTVDPAARARLRRDRKPDPVLGRQARQRDRSSSPSRSSRST